MLDQTLLLLRNAIWMMRELELQTDPKSTDKKLQQHSACIDKMLSRWEGGGAAGGEEDGEVLLQPLGLSGLVLQHTHCLSN